MKKKIFLTVISCFFISSFINAKWTSFPRNLKPNGVHIYSDSIDFAIKSIEINTTRDYINDNDEINCIKALKPVTIKVADYMYTKYVDFDIRNEVNDYPLEVAMMGVFQLLKEKNYPADYASNGQMRAATDPFDCFMAALSGVIGIGEINSLYQDFSNGATPRTVFRTMKTMLRRVAGAITIAVTVVELAICLFD